MNHKLRVATWNVAAVNNNPFEYYVDHDDPAYFRMLRCVEELIDSPGDRDVMLGTLINDAMFADLCRELEIARFAHVDAARECWARDLKKRRVVSGFLKDEGIGAKRLCSMPDRVTNKINTGLNILYRPSVISCFEGKILDMHHWWEQWKAFMFTTEVKVVSKNGETVSKRVFELLSPISRKKYPAVAEHEEFCSLPLQMMCLAAFDASLVYIMRSVAPDEWHGIKMSLVAALHKDKYSRTIEILESPLYMSSDVIFLQEVAAVMVQHLQKHPIIHNGFHVLSPESLDAERDQNSIILLSKSRFLVDDLSSHTSWKGEITSQISALLRDESIVANGDLFVVRCVMKPTISEQLDPFSHRRRHTNYLRCILASFHGDTNGLATIPVVDAIHKHLRLFELDELDLSSSYSVDPPLLLVGMDANTHKTHEEGKRQGVIEFAQHLAGLNLATCWGAVDPNVHTTYNARTYLQPQLNKAVRMSERACSPFTDKNPKDHILFQISSHLNDLDGCEVQRAGFSTEIVSRDNTGTGTFAPHAPFPTLKFPSDHAIVSAELQLENQHPL